MALSICHWLNLYASSLGIHHPSFGTPGQEQEENKFIPMATATEDASGQATLLRGIAARIAQEMALSQSNIFDVAVLAEVLELPFAQAWQMLRPLALVTSQLLRQLSRRRPLRRNEGTWLSFQIAYLRALDALLHQEASLQRPWLDAAKIPLTGALALSPKEALENASLATLLDNLRNQRLTDLQAEQALVSGAQSALVQQIRRVMVVWLTFNGAEEREAELLIQRLEHGLAGHLLATIAENATPLAQLQKFVRLGNLSSWSSSEDGEQDYEIVEEHASSKLTIEPQRELYRAQLLQSLGEPLLGQVFSLQDLYIPQQGQARPLLPQGHPHPPEASPPEDALLWVLEHLAQPQQIPIIEAGAGQGKTCFCHQLAVRLAQDLYPVWMPIVISLRGLPLGATLEETLAPALPSGLFMERDSWLSADNPPCVLILDGLDELPLGPDGEGQISLFLAQLQAFQNRYRNEPVALDLELGAATAGPRHRIVLTTQPTTFDTLIKAHPELYLEQQYRRLRLLPMNQAALKLWFRQWAQLQNKAIAQSYFNFLKNGGAFRKQSQVAVAASAHWPFTLLLMALLHRDGFLDERIFELSAESLQFEIYERLNTWLLGAATDAYPQPGMMADRSRIGPAHACRSPDVVANLLAGRSPRSVRHHIQTVAFQVLQSGRGRLMSTAQGNPMAQPLPSLYFQIQPAPPSAPSALPPGDTPRTENFWISFTSPNLGDYSCAEAIAAALEKITQRRQTSYGETYILATPEALAQHLYQLLGHGPLSPRLVSFTLERLRREQQRESPGVSLRVLGDRLYEFYRYYCQGRWLDEGLPQAAYQTFRALDNPFSMMQVDAAVGLNAFTLLCALARETDVPFWPCGNPRKVSEYNPNRLLQLMGRTAILSPLAFWVYARQQLSSLHLSKARLTQVMLVGADLGAIDCREASLMGSNLEGADLTDANLAGSNLQRVNLRHSRLVRTNLQGADLRYADLTGAQLEEVNLANTCVAHAHMDVAVSAMAQECGAFFSITEYQVYHQLMRSEADDEPLSNSEIDDTLGRDSAMSAQPSTPTGAIAPSWPSSSRDEKTDLETAQLANGDVIALPSPPSMASRPAGWILNPSHSAPPSLDSSMATSDAQSHPPAHPGMEILETQALETQALETQALETQALETQAISTQALKESCTPSRPEDEQDEHFEGKHSDHEHSDHELLEDECSEDETITL